MESAPKGSYNRTDLREQLNDLKNLAGFLEEHRSFVNVHMVDFLILGHWENFLSPDLAEELLSLSDEELSTLGTREFFDLPRIREVPNLHKLMMTTFQYSLPQMQLASNISEIFTSTEDSSPEVPDYLQKWWMSKKKNHEVSAMGNFLAAFMKSHRVETVIDVGSGKGYLSSHLASFHQFQVVGIESTPQRNSSALMRSQKLHLEIEKRKCTKVSAPFRESGPSEENNSSLEEVESLSPLFRHFSCSEEFANGDEGDHHHADSSTLNVTNEGQDLTVTEKTESTNKSTKHNDRCLENLNFHTITARVDKNFDFPAHLASVLEGSTSESVMNIPCMICGLHTCGNLASCLINMFLTYCNMRLLCFIGCCYHLMEEEFNVEPCQNSGEDCQDDFGFPLSSTLRKRKFFLGRNARMLASQSVERNSQQKTVSAKPLFYRAVLEVLLMDKVKVIDKDFRVGRLAQKSLDFIDYTRKALKKLGCGDVEVTDEEILAYEERFKGEEKKLNAFQKLRIAFAPCVEAIIILDQLTYLLEQDRVAEAHLLQLFDPVTSPRCYALVAVKKNSTTDESKSNTAQSQTIQE